MRSLAAAAPKTAALRRTASISIRAPINRFGASERLQRRWQENYRDVLSDQNLGMTENSWSFLHECDVLERSLFRLYDWTYDVERPVPCHVQECPALIPEVEPTMRDLFTRGLRRQLANGGSLEDWINEEAFGTPDGVGWGLLEARLYRVIPPRQRPRVRSLWKLYLVHGDDQPSHKTIVLWPTLLTKYFAGMAHLEGWQRYLGGVARQEMGASVNSAMRTFSNQERMGLVAPMDTSP